VAAPARQPGLLTPAWKIGGEALVAFDREPDFAEGVLALVGLPFELDLHQTITIADDVLGLSLWHDRRGRYVLRVESGWRGPNRQKHGRPKPPASLALAELFAIAQAGQMILLNGPTLARVKRRLLVDLGFAAATPISRRPLPASAPTPALRAYEVICRLVEVRPPNDPFSASRSLLRIFGGITARCARDGLGWLRRNRYISLVGQADFGQPIPALLYRLGHDADPPPPGGGDARLDEVEA
jgi:hypothetical protein